MTARCAGRISEEQLRATEEDDVARKRLCEDPKPCGRNATGLGDSRGLDRWHPDYTEAPLTMPERVMVEYVVQPTKDATKISRTYHERLREVGFDDKGTLQITLIASWFSYINRVADSLGVGRNG